MLQKAVDKARIEIANAEESLTSMDTNDWATIEKGWNGFVGAAGRVYSKLQQGAKADEASRAWFEEAVRTRSADPLLSYLWTARNVVEHTIEEVSGLNPGYAREVEPITSDRAALEASMADETRPWIPLGLIEVQWPHPQLLPLRDRQRVVPVPNEHLGQPLGGMAVIDVGRAALRYLAQIVEQAAELADRAAATPPSVSCARHGAIL